MHEASLVTSLLRQANDLAIQHGANRIVEIHVEVGPLAGIEPILFEEAFQRLRGNSLAAEADLTIDAVGLTCHCRACHLKYVTEELLFVCPTCESVDVDVLHGDSVILTSVTLANPMEAVSSL